MVDYTIPDWTSCQNWEHGHSLWYYTSEAVFKYWTEKTCLNDIIIIPDKNIIGGQV
jgi:hypothetical protein